MTNLVALIALVCWIPVSAAIFLSLPIARAVAASYVVGWLFLPFVTYHFPGIPDFSKATAIFLGSSLGLLLHKDARQALSKFRVTWIDVPACLLLAGAFATSLVNGLGVWDGAAAAIGLMCTWVGPYFLARIVFRSIDDVRVLAETIVLGGLAYVPLCLFEIRMSPMLHEWVYGCATGLWPGMRFGGYRPNVFLETGLELGMWMTACSLVACCLWRQGRYTKFFGVPMSLLVLALLATTLLCKSTGALGLFVLGLGCWLVGRFFRSAKPSAIMLLVSVAYIIVRTSGLYDGAEVVDLARQYVSADRAESLEFRLKNEELLKAKVFKQPWFGWGGWGRSRVYDDAGQDISITDGCWIIVFGVYGAVGLVGTYGILLCPCVAVIRRYGGQLCFTAAAAPVAALTTVVAVFAIDSLLNSFSNPIYILSAGAVGTIAQLSRKPAYNAVIELAPTQQWCSRQRRSWPRPARQHSANSEA